MTLGATSDPPHPVRQRRRLRLQDPARRARGRRPRPDRPTVAGPAGRSRRRRRRRRRAARRRHRRGRDRRLLHPGRRRRVRLGPDRRRERAVGRVRDGRPAAGRGQPRRLAAQRAAGRAARRGAARRRGRRPRGRPATSPAATASTTPSPSTAWRSPASSTRDRLLRNDAAQAGLPLTLTKPLGVGRAQQPAQGDRRGVRARRRQHGRPQPGRLGGRGRRRARGRPPTSPASGCSGTSTRWSRASGVTAVVDAAAVPYLDGAREALAAGYVSGGTRRNLDWVRPHLAGAVGEDELLLLADAQTSGGLLVVGEVPGAPSSATSCRAARRPSRSAEPACRSRPPGKARPHDGRADPSPAPVGLPRPEMWPAGATDTPFTASRTTSRASRAVPPEPGLGRRRPDDRRRRPGRPRRRPAQLAPAVAGVVVGLAGLVLALRAKIFQDVKLTTDGRLLSA